MKVIIKNIAVEYADEGKGPVAVLLHGWQDDLHTFDLLAHELQGWRLVRMDLPGFGGSEVPPDTWNLDDYVDCVAAFIDKLGLQPSLLIGHSFGGRIAIKGVATRKLTPEKIVLIASAGVAHTATLRTQALKLAAKVGKAVTLVPPLIFWREQLRRKMYERAGSDFLSAGPLQAIFLSVIHEDLRSAAAEIDCPTLLIWGEHDRATPVSDARILAGLIKRATLKILPDASHFVHQEEPVKVAAYIKGFA